MLTSPNTTEQGGRVPTLEARAALDQVLASSRLSLSPPGALRSGRAAA